MVQNMHSDGPTPTARGVVQHALSTLDLPPIYTQEETHQLNEMNIRKAQPKDLEAIQELLSSLDLPYRDLTPAHLEHFFIAQTRNDLVGVVGLEPYHTTALVRSLGVRRTHRDRGIGAQLTERIEEYARRCGVEDLYLLTTTAADYFDRRGYEMVRRDALPKAIQETDEATRLCPSSATCMRKNLGETTEVPD